MILYLRSTLLATENGTSCLQRLLNFPDDVNLEKLIKKEKSLQALVVDANNSNPLLIHAKLFDRSKSTVVRGHGLSMDSTSPKTPLSLVLDSYWEETWRVLRIEEEHKQDALVKQAPIPRRSWSEKVKLHLSGIGSAPSPSKTNGRNKEPQLSVRRNLLEDLAWQLRLDKDVKKMVPIEQVSEKPPDERNGQDENNENYICISQQICLTTNAGSEETSYIFSDLPSPVSGEVNDCENQLRRSSVASNSSIDEVVLLPKVGFDASGWSEHQQPAKIGRF